MGFMDIFRASAIKEENVKLKEELEKLKIANSDLIKANTKLEVDAAACGITEYYQAKEKIDSMNKELSQRMAATESEIEDKKRAAETKMRLIEERDNKTINDNNATIARLREEIATLTEKYTKLTNQVITQTRKLSRSKELYNSISYAIDNYFISCRI